MVLVISEAVSTSEKFNVKIKNNTKQQYIEHNEAVPMHVVSCDTQSANSTAPDPKYGNGKYSLRLQFNGKLALDNWYTGWPQKSKPLLNDKKSY